MRSLEWLVEDSKDVVVYGLMVREFGLATGGIVKGTAHDVQIDAPIVAKLHHVRAHNP